MLFVRPRFLCLVVLGLHRGGTSIVASILHHLGVNMGDSFCPPDDRNQIGFYEDVEFLEIHDKIIGDDWSNPKIRFTENRNEYFMLLKKKSQKLLWGVKDPKLCLFFHSFIDVAQEAMPNVEIRVIDVVRDIELIANSICNPKFPSSLDIKGAMSISRTYSYAKKSGMKSFKGKVLKIEHSELMINPRKCVRELANFSGVKFKDSAVEIIRTS